MTRPSSTKLIEQLPIGEWNKLSPASNFVNHACSFGTSIWLLVNTIAWPLELVEYDCVTDTFKESVPYPFQVAIGYISVCTYKEDTIVIASNIRGIFTFDVNTKVFSEAVMIPNVGSDATIFAVGDHIHICHGGNNPSVTSRDAFGRYPPGKYIIFSMNDRVVKTFVDDSCSFTMTHVNVVQRVRANKGITETMIAGFARLHCNKDIALVVVSIIFEYLKIVEFYKFGGGDYRSDQGIYRPLDSFYIGKLQDDHGAKPIQWTQTPKYSLKTRDDNLCHRHYVFQTDAGTVFLGFHWGDWEIRTKDIYVSSIDCDGKQQCMQRSIQSPILGIRVQAVVMDHQGNVHFFGEYFENEVISEEKRVRTHHAIPLQYIIDNAGVAT